MHHGRSYSQKGQTPVVKKVGKKIKINMISAVTNRGSVRWMSYTSTMTQRKYILFLSRLVAGQFALLQQRRGKVGLGHCPVTWVRRLVANPQRAAEGRCRYTQPVGLGRPATLQAPFAGPDGNSS